MHSIKQNPSTPNLPNFTQLGVMFRIVWMTCIVSATYALFPSRDATTFVSLFSQSIALLFPILLTVLLGLYLINARLAKQAYGWACAIILCWSTVCTYAWLSINKVDWVGTQKGIFSALIWCFVLLYYFRLREMALSPAIAEARLQALQARIRPHFLFNSLNAVLGLIRVDPRRAERVIENLADLFRVLMADNRQLVPLEKELELARQYLEIEQVRLGDRLQLEWHVSKMPSDAMIPPLVLQPLLENAVFHGVERSTGVGQIAVNIYGKRREVFIQIRNTYSAQVESHHAGNKMALANIRERLMLHFDMEAELTIQPSHEYFQVMIRMPYQKEAQ